MIRSIAFPIGLAALTAGCGSAGDSFNESFNENFRSSCVASASKSGVPADISGKYCECVLTKVDEKYSASEKVGLSQGDLAPLASECMSSLVPPNG